MQENCKIEQPTSPPYSSLTITPPITPKSSNDFMQIITKFLMEGQESAQFIRGFLNEGLGLKVEDHNQADLDHHSLVTLNSLENALSMLKSFDFDQAYIIRKRKLDRTDNIESSVDDDHHSNKAGRGTVSKERRGCYKRRKFGQTWTEEATELTDDGHAWRKYGQKDILNTKYPRNYYRCTHKNDQDCQATKQVQQISENPTKYNIIYNGDHTCKNPHKTPSIILDQEENSSFISFETTKNYPTVKNSPFFFPSTTFHNTYAMVKQEYTTSIKEDLPISPSGPLISGTHSNLQYSSCSENLPSSSDLATSTPVSDQGDSYDYGFYEDELFNLCMDHTHFPLDEIM